MDLFRTAPIIVALLAAASQTALAADPPKPAAPVTAPLLTLTELRACLDDKDSLAQRRADLEREMKEREAVIKAFEAEGESIGAAQAAVNVKDAAAIAAFNQRVADHNAKGGGYNAQVAALNARAAQLQADSTNYRDRCVDRRFSTADEQAIQKERAKAASAPKP